MSATDPDTGSTASTWDDLGQLTSATDAAGKTITWAYAAAGRRTAEYNTTGGAAPSGSNQLAAWTYDTAALDNPVVGSSAKAIGQLAAAASYAGGSSGEAYTVSTGKYSSLYQPETASPTRSRPTLSPAPWAAAAASPTSSPTPMTPLAR